MSKKSKKNNDEIEVEDIIRYKYFDSSAEFEMWQNMNAPFVILGIHPVSKEHKAETSFTSKWWQFGVAKSIGKVSHTERIFVTYKLGVR